MDKSSETDPAPDVKASGQTGASGEAPAIEVRALRKSFGSLEVLTGIDFTVARGEVVCVIGPSGSGKSTLLRCVNRLEEPTSGTILVAARRSPTRTWTSTRCAAASGWSSSRSTSSPI